LRASEKSAPRVRPVCAPRPLSLPPSPRPRGEAAGFERTLLHSGPWPIKRCRSLCEWPCFVFAGTS